MSAENEKSSLDEIKEYFEGQDRIIDQHGHACAYYDSAQDDSLGFQIVYTVGLSDVDWPELVCAAPLSPDRTARPKLPISLISEEPRVGKQWVSPFRSRLSPFHSKKKTK